MKVIHNYLLILLRVALVFCVFILVSVMIMQVFMRYVFSNPFVWAEELSRYMMIFSIMIGSTLVVNESRHVKVDIFVNMLPARARYAAKLMVELLFIGMSVFLVVQGVLYAQTMVFITTPGLGISKAIIAASIPAFATIWVIFGINNLYKFIRSEAKP